MGVFFSKPVVEHKLVSVLINIPQLVDDLEPNDLRKLAQVSKDVNRAVDHPTVWKVQFSKLLGVEPAKLPAAGNFCFQQPLAFKHLIRGVQTARDVAYNTQRPTNGDDAFAISSAYAYLLHHFPESADAFGEILDELRWLSHDKGMGLDKEELCAGAVSTTVGAVVGTKSASAFAAVPAKVALPGVKLAKVVSILGVKGTKVALYSFYGAGVALGAAGVGYGMILTTEALVEARRHHINHQRRLRDVRIRTLVAERRGEKQ